MTKLFNICWKLLLLKSIKSTWFQQTFNNFGSPHVLWQVSFGFWVTWSISSWQEYYKSFFLPKSSDQGQNFFFCLPATNAQIFCKMNPLNSLRFTFHQKNWGKCLLFNLANDCLLNWANSQKWQLSSLKLLFWVKIGVIIWICSALQSVLSFSAWEKSCDSTHRIFILEHKMRS